MRVVVVGATGNVGMSVVSALAADPAVDLVVGVARRPRAPEMAKVEWRHGDVTVPGLAAGFEGADAVVHLAWALQPSHDERRLHAVNVDGSARVFSAVAEAGVPALVYASSVGAYAAGPSGRAVDESWPATGVPSSVYGRQKAQVEALLDHFQAEHPEVRVVRLRPGLIFKRSAAAQIKRYFVGAVLPRWAIRRSALPVLPWPSGLRLQAVHSTDVGDAYRRAVAADVRGAFNIAAEPVLGPSEFGRVLHARPVSIPPAAARTLLAATWRARLQPSEPGWLDLALAVPVMATSRARHELGWAPTVSSIDAVSELLEGMPEGAQGPTPALRG
jgi:nucleoside-diphosphate-sugar epimerase